MLFYLSDSLIVSNEDPIFRRVFSAVRNLIIAASQGKHVVTADYSTLSVLEVWYRNDFEIYGHLHKLRAEYSTSISPQAVSYYIEVVKELDPNGSQRNGIGVMAVTDFLDNDRVSQTSLIGENDYDCQFFEWILKWYKQTVVPRRDLHTSMSHINGAGGSTPTAIQKELQKKHVSVCIVDTDVRFPGDRIKNDSTCKKCRRVARHEPFFLLLELNVHEIENLIPINFLEHIDEWNGDSGKKKEAFDFISGDPSIMPYFDIKKGVQKSSVVGDDLYNFGKKCYQHNHIMVESGSYEELYARADKYVYPGLNEQALKHTLNYLDNNSNPERPVLMDFQRQNWEKIGEALLNYCVAHNSEMIY